MNIPRLTLFLGIVIGPSLESFAQAPPPATPFEQLNWKATMSRKPSAGVRMGAFAVRFESTTLDDVRRAASVGQVSHRGDAGESVYWLCYTSVHAPRVERIWIVADGAMGGAKHYVTGISAEVLPGGRASADCPALPTRLTPLSLDNNVWLGAREGAATARLGAPSYRKGGWRSYDFQGREPGQCAGGFDFISWVRLHVQSGRVNSLHAGQVTSC